jgi:hypothetical protein
MAEWRSIIKNAEQLVLTHYFQRLGEYLNSPNRYDSWLAAQCNQTSGWNPRLD